MQDPRLPRDLERQIFLIALQHNFADVGNLLFISKRVHDWLHPSAFKVVVLTRDRKFPILFTLEKFQKYGHHIRSLYIGPDIGVDQTRSLEYISLCPNLTNLATFQANIDPIRLQDTLSPLQLTRLVIEAMAILYAPPSAQLLQLFANITHLHLLGPFSPDLKLFPGLPPPFLEPFFPSLTHIAFLYTYIRNHLENAIQGWKTLQAVVLWSPSRAINEQLAFEMQSLHPRLVFIHCQMVHPWDGARGSGPDIWELADTALQSSTRIWREPRRVR
ncbi:hypothetical protein BDN72DRAFT_332321 [Pluteus cervinus]|uniref:Uncharacterized protein n=1 Tax=Pluteus cervinus TaxID=181527 RepID=A0ACD3ABS9_9AGAR|nr:hypothetical protein BDN72DRAFT_332321 [Pluteus cervinus]